MSRRYQRYKFEEIAPLIKINRQLFENKSELFVTSFHHFHIWNGNMPKRIIHSKNSFDISYT